MIAASAPHQTPRPPSTCAIPLWYVPGIPSKVEVDAVASERRTNMNLDRSSFAGALNFLFGDYPPEEASSDASAFLVTNSGDQDLHHESSQRENPDHLLRDDDASAR